MITIHVNKAGESIQVDFEALPENVKAHIIEYGLKQKFNDVHSAEKDGKTAMGLVKNLLKRLMAGELTKSRNAGSPVERELHSLLVQVARVKTTGKVTDLRAMETEELVKAVANAIGKPAEKVEAHFTALAESNVAKRAEEKAALSKGLADID